MVDIPIPTKVNPDLQKERDSRSFDVDELTWLVDGGLQKTKKRRQILSLLFSDHHFLHTEDRYLLSYEDRYAAALANTVRIMELTKKHHWSSDDVDTAISAIRSETGVGVHFIMFLPALERLCSPEQAAKWMPLAKSMKIVGTYAQTEIGHGTNLRKLQTRADFDPATGEFVLNTPLPTGMKWWPGGLGKSCNHMILLAQLYIRGQNCGMQAFMVQIRDMNTHKSLPGVQVGDIGPRYNSLPADNGYLILRNVRIPRENMLGKNAEVTHDGQFVKKVSDSRANYSAMVYVRTMIVGWSAMFMAYSTTVATRYSAVRRQSELEPGKPEVQVLDFQTQQYKLFPNIALAYALFFTKNYMLDRFHITEQEIKKGIFDSMPELHSQSCGLKAYTTDISTEAAEVLRRSCGGHGYLLAGGIAPLVADASSSVTVEGENTVLYQQVARYLMKCFASVMTGEQQDGFTAYFNQKPDPCPIKSALDCDNLEALCLAFQCRAYYALSRVARRLQAAVASGTPQYVAWNDNCVDLVAAAKGHMEYFVVLNFVKNVRELKASPEICQVMSLLCQLHALHRIVVNSGEFLLCGAINGDQLEIIRLRELSLLPRIRPDAVSLVDAFDLHDNTLMSALGAYDGNVYERLFAMAQKSPLNKTDVHSSFYKYIKPMQQKANL